MKGDYNQECNRTACNNDHAIFYNQSTQKHYCRECAQRINEVNPESYALYGTPLCMPTINDDAVNHLVYHPELTNEDIEAIRFMWSEVYALYVEPAAGQWEKAKFPIEIGTTVTTVYRSEWNPPQYIFKPAVVNAIFEMGDVWGYIITFADGFTTAYLGRYLEPIEIVDTKTPNVNPELN